jgi:hypothetical protein
MKLIEIGDRSTIHPAIAVRGPATRRRGGFSLDGASIILMRFALVRISQGAHHSRGSAGSDARRAWSASTSGEMSEIRRVLL